MAQLLELPRRALGTADTVLNRSTSVDDWGRDAHLLRAIQPLLRLRWQVSVGGDQHLPARAGALLVTNQRRFSQSPMYVAWALSEATGRPVRFVGRPDIAPLGPALARLGGLLDDPAEVEGALRNGQLVVIGAAPTAHPRHAGAVDHELVGAAVSTGVSVHPVASMSGMFTRGARAEVGPVVRNRRKRRGTLAEVELAEAVQHSLQKLLDELGGVQTGMTAIDWLGEG